MKKHHTTIVLATLFFTGLIVLWWADDTGLDREVSDAILPALGKIQVVDIKRIEVLRPEKEEAKTEPKADAKAATATTTAPRRIVVERRDEGRWQIVEPIDAAADPSLIETLARNLKDMRKSPDAGTIHDPPRTFGLAPPAATIRVFGTDWKNPLTTLDVGKSVRDQLYLRPEGGDGIEVVDPRILGILRIPLVDWRDKSLFQLPSFRVGTLSVTGPGRDLKAEREEGHWHLDRPFSAVADDDKVEGMVAELTSLRIARGRKGFVANDVKDNDKDAAKYGLNPPAMTIELRPAFGPGKPQTLLVGKPEADKSDLYYARTGDQDDVVLVDAKSFHDLCLDPNALRSKKVVELSPAQVEFIRVEAFGHTFDLSRTATGWEQIQPTREEADSTFVGKLLSGLAEVQTSEFLEPSRVTRPGIDPPRMTLKLWQAAPRVKPAVGLKAPPKSEPRVVLHIGNVDGLSKMVFARLEGDPSLLAIPEPLDEVLPRNPLAFRDRTVLTLSPAQILRLTIHRAGTTYELVAPAAAGKSTHWQMTAPVKSTADLEAVTKVVTLLSNLDADQYITDQAGDGKAFGLNAPALTVTWTTPTDASADKARDQETKTGTLRIGAKLPKSELWYANIEGSAVVFTLPTRVVETFEAEFHNHRVLAFDADAVRRLVLRWPSRTLTFKPQENPAGDGFRWVPEPGSDATGFDVSRVGPLVGTLAGLTTPKFLQYRGPIPAATGLDAPRLVIEVHVGDDPEKPVPLLRLGKTTDERAYATTASGTSGPVFVLTGPAWSGLVRVGPGSGSGELPEDVFAPAVAKPPQGDARTSPP